MHASLRVWHHGVPNSVWHHGIRRLALYHVAPWLTVQACRRPSGGRPIRLRVGVRVRQHGRTRRPGAGRATAERRQSDHRATAERRQSRPPTARGAPPARARPARWAAPAGQSRGRVCPALQPWSLSAPPLKAPSKHRGRCAWPMAYGLWPMAYALWPSSLTTHYRLHCAGNMAGK